MASNVRFFFCTMFKSDKLLRFWFCTLLVVTVVLMIAIDDYGLDIYPHYHFSFYKERVDKGYWSMDMVNTSFDTAYETWDEFYEGYIEGTYFAQLPDKVAKRICTDSSSLAVISIFLAAMLIGFRYSDHSFDLMCRSGQPRWKVIIAALLWFYGMVFLIVWLSVLVNFTRILLFSYRLPHASYWARLLILRPLAACGGMSVPILIAVGLKKIHWSLPATLTWLMLQSNRFTIGPIRWINPLKYITDNDIWTLQGNLPLTLEMIGFTLAVMLVCAGLTVLVFRRREL